MPLIGRGLASFGSKASPNSKYAEKGACPRRLTRIDQHPGTGPFLHAVS